MKVLAPGKLILSGEHAVVHGQPALAMAINRYVIATATPQFLPFVSFELSDLAYRNRMSFSALSNLKKRIKAKYEKFIHGDFKIREVLQKPFELAQFSMMLFMEMLNLKLTHGIKLHIQSEIPIGCGMGSSAATILSVVHAVAHHLQVELPDDLFYRLGLEAENLQHGFSSGLDLQVSLNGGCLFFKEGKLINRDIPNFKMYLINTGAPTSTTGDCVMHAKKYFINSSIATDFGCITEAMDNALQNNQMGLMKDLLKANHQLLTRIGVVPLRIRNFMDELSAFGGAGKICGAGSISGDAAGVVLAITEDELALEKICAQYRFEVLPIEGVKRGVHVSPI